MDMLTPDKLREAIARVSASWEAYPSAISKFKIVGVRDERNDRYVLEHIDFGDDRYATRLLANLEICDGKVGILSDNTEERIATKLFAEGCPLARMQQIDEMRDLPTGTRSRFPRCRSQA